MSGTTTENRDRLCGEGVRMMGRMAHTIRSLRTYPIDSPAIQFGLNGIATAATNLLSLSIEDVRLVLAGDRVRVGDYTVSPPPGMLAALRELRGWLRERGVSGLILSGGVAPEHVRAVMGVLRDVDPEFPPEDGALNRALESLSVPGIRFVPCPPIRIGLPGADPDEAPAVSILRLYLRGLRGMARLNEQGSSPAVLLELARLVQGIIDLMMDDPRKALALMAGRGAAPYRQAHPLHRTILALVMGRRLGMREKGLLDLGLCALSADCGLQAVPEAVLTKAGPLKGKAAAAMRRHPLESVRMLLGAGALSPALRRRLLVAFELRLGFDGTGYPRPLLWPELHPFTRIIALTEGYDALRSARPWREAKTARQTMKILQEESGTRYDPMLVEELGDMLRTYQFEDPDAR